MDDDIFLAWMRLVLCQNENNQAKLSRKIFFHSSSPIYCEKAITIFTFRKFDKAEREIIFLESCHRLANGLEVPLISLLLI